MSRRAGYTLVEFAVVVIIVGLCAGALLERLQRTQELAERAAMEATLRLIRTGLQIRLAELILANRQAEAPRLEVENPTLWLSEKPPNYAGEYREPAERGAWYYDAQRRELVYVVNLGRGLDGVGEAKQLRFRAKLLFDPVQAPGGVVRSVTGITLEPVRAYRWSGTAFEAILAQVLLEYQGHASDFL
jgi:general secretion pathway protein G